MAVRTRKQRQKFYKRLKEEGRYGYFSDPTWNKKRKLHTCCKSKVRWYHRVGCPAANANFDLEGTKRYRSKLQLKIQKLKSKGKNSEEIAKKMSLPLSEVNRIFTQIDQ